MAVPCSEGGVEQSEEDDDFLDDPTELVRHSQFGRPQRAQGLLLFSVLSSSWLSLWRSKDTMLPLCGSEMLSRIPTPQLHLCESKQKPTLYEHLSNNWTTARDVHCREMLCASWAMHTCLMKTQPVGVRLQKPFITQAQARNRDPSVCTSVRNQHSSVSTTLWVDKEYVGYLTRLPLCWQGDSKSLILAASCAFISVQECVVNSNKSIQEWNRCTLLCKRLKIKNAEKVWCAKRRWHSQNAPSMTKQSKFSKHMNYLVRQKEKKECLLMYTLVVACMIEVEVSDREWN